MITVSIIYPNSEGATFDEDYYKNRHLPMIGQLFTQFGISFASVVRGLRTIEGGDPPHLMMAWLTFPTLQNAKLAMESEGARQLMRDVPNFTNVQPVVQYNLPID